MDAFDTAGPAARSLTGEAPSVLIVDDDMQVLRSYSRMLQSHGYSVKTADSGRAAIDALQLGSFDVILSDVDMPGMSGIDLLKKVRTINPDVPLVLITGSPSLATATAAVEQGAL